MSPENISISTEIEQPKNVWNRVSEDALNILKTKENINDELMKKAEELVVNIDFIQETKENWKEQTLAEHVDDNPETQEKEWAKGLAIVILEKLNENM